MPPLVGNRRAVDGSGLAQASLTIVGAWADRSVPVCPSSPMTLVPWAIGSTSRVTTPVLP